MRDKRVVAGVALLAFGIGLNLLDAYFSGNLPFSPVASDGNNKLSMLNRLGKANNEDGWRLGSLLAVLGGVITGFLWLLKKK